MRRLPPIHSYHGYRSGSYAVFSELVSLSVSAHPHFSSICLIFSLCCHTKPLFLIDDQKPQIFEFHILRQHPVCSDHDIHQSLFQHPRPSFSAAPVYGTGTSDPHPHREIFHPLYKCIVMLLCKNRCRHQIDYLLTLLHCFECRTDCNLRLAIIQHPRRSDDP